VSNQVLLEISLESSKTAARLLRRQWEAFTPVWGGERGSAGDGIVDLEALILASMVFAHHDRRLWDVATWWAFNGSRFTSVHRMKSQVLGYSEDSAREALSDFAQSAKEGGDHRWEKFLATASERNRGSDAEFGNITLRCTASLLPRLRSAFGVGVKPDVLTYLIGAQSDLNTASDIAKGLGYTPQAVRQALQDMEVSGLVVFAGTRPAYVRVDRELWRGLLGLDEKPTWRFYGQVLAFLGDTNSWAIRNAAADRSIYILASEAREMLERHESAFVLNGLLPPATSHLTGTDFFGAINEGLETIDRWIGESLS